MAFRRRTCRSDRTADRNPRINEIADNWQALPHRVLATNYPTPGTEAAIGHRSEVSIRTGLVLQVTLGEHDGAKSRRRLRASADTELVQQVMHVILHRVDRDTEFIRDIAVR